MPGEGTWTWFCSLMAPRACARKNRAGETYVNQIVDFLDVSPKARVGAGAVLSRVRTEFRPGRYGTRGRGEAGGPGRGVHGPGTMTGLALRHMVEHSFSEAQARGQGSTCPAWAWSSPTAAPRITSPCGRRRREEGGLARAGLI